MSKFLAVVGHEYRKIVKRWAFVIGTLLFPALAAASIALPALIFSIQGEPARIVVVDEGSGVAARIKEALKPVNSADSAEKMADASMKEQLSMSQDEKLRRAAQARGPQVAIVDFDSTGKSFEESEARLREMVIAKQIDGYMLIPNEAVVGEGQVRYFSRKAGDFVTNQVLEDTVNESVRAKRLSDARIDEGALKEINRRVGFDVKKVDKTGDTASEGVFAVSFIIGLMIYIILAIYGQQVLGAVVEEKETRIAEILFSSASPFTLMFGKLVGVGLAALTQLGVWISAAAAVTVYGFAASGFAGIEIPTISVTMVGLFLLYFLLGFFLYASIFALIGSMVTTVQEGGQFSLPPVMLLLMGFYFSTAVIRDPSSSVAFWVSIVPFLAPITMPVRIMAEMPPLWQILLSVLVNVVTILLMVWTSGRVYRVGMLMYGKRATIPEVLRWIRTN